MKSLRLIVISMVFAAFLTVSAMAQATQKIALINTQAFYDEKAGIAKIINGIKRVDTEMKPKYDERNAKVTQFQTLKKSYDTLVDNRTKNIPVKDEDIQSKYDQLQNMQKDIKRMDEDIKLQEDKRMGEVMSPISNDIGVSIETFAKQKGYNLVLDVSRLAGAGVVLYYDDATDITKDFITFYNNAKPAGTATK